jgi:hypothetical protein
MMKKLNLSDDEVDEVVESLKTLAGDPVEPRLMQPLLDRDALELQSQRVEEPMPPRTPRPRGDQM